MATRMAAVARDQDSARPFDIIASKQGYRSHRSTLAFVIDLVDTTTAAAAHTSFTATTFASTVVASCKLVVARVSFTASAIVNTFAAVDIAFITGTTASSNHRLASPYLPSKYSFCLTFIFIDFSNNLW